MLPLLDHLLSALSQILTAGHTGILNCHNSWRHFLKNMKWKDTQEKEQLQLLPINVLIKNKFKAIYFYFCIIYIKNMSISCSSSWILLCNEKMWALRTDFLNAHIFLLQYLLVLRPSWSTPPTPMVVVTTHGSKYWYRFTQRCKFLHTWCLYDTNNISLELPIIFVYDDAVRWSKWFYLLNS